MPIDGLVWWFPIWLQKELGGQTQPHFQPMQCRKNPPKKNRSLAKGEIRQGTGRKPGSRLFETNQGCNLGFWSQKTSPENHWGRLQSVKPPHVLRNQPKMELSDGIHHINIYLPHIVTTKIATRYPCHYVLCGTPRLQPQKPSTLGLPFRAGLAQCVPDLGEVLPDVSAWGVPPKPMALAPWGGFGRGYRPSRQARELSLTQLRAGCRSS